MYYDYVRVQIEGEDFNPDKSKQLLNLAGCMMNYSPFS